MPKRNYIKRCIAINDHSNNSFSFFPNKEANKKRIPIIVDDDDDSNGQKASQKTSSSDDKESAPDTSTHDVDVTLTKVTINHVIPYTTYPMCRPHLTSSYRSGILCQDQQAQDRTLLC